MTVYQVTTFGDSGPGSLRQAISDANLHVGPDTITFGIGAGGGWTISPTSALPDVTDPVVIDGTTQGGYVGAPLITIDGSSAGDTSGLKFATGSDGSVVEGLNFIKFANTNRAGVELDSDNNQVIACWFGAVGSGSNLDANYAGVNIIGAGNSIGSTSSIANTISGNSIGVWISGGNPGNKIQGNLIGLTADGFNGLGNNRGVLLDVGAHGNFVGTDGDGVADSLEGNTISGNAGTFGYGVQISGGSANMVAGNRIGLDPSGASVGNEIGVVVNFGSTNNTIGTNSDSISDQDERNYISGNTGGAIWIASSNSTVVAGNYVGVDMTGSSAVGNGAGDAVYIQDGSFNTIGGSGPNAGNVVSGAQIAGDIRGIAIRGASSTGNSIAGNLIGTDASGTLALPNLDGVYIESATATTIGGLSPSDRNVISGNRARGVNLKDAPSTLIEGNYIGTDYTGIFALGNGTATGSSGVLLSTSDNCTIGGPVGNIISDSGARGIRVAGSSGTAILGNTIGLNLLGNALGNADQGIILDNGSSGVTIGGVSAFDRNVISSNGSWGIELNGVSNNVILGNYVGTDPTGSASRGNTFDGIFVFGTSQFNTIGGSAGSENVISGNTQVGIRLSGAGATQNSVIGNIIGLKADRSGPLANPIGSVTINTGASAQLGGTFNGDVYVDGTLDLAGNAVSIVGALLGPGQVTNSAASGGATLTINGGGTFDGTIQDGATATVALAIAGGIVSLWHANAFTGFTTIAPGAALVLYQSGANFGTLGTGPIVDGGTLTIQRDGSLNVSQAISGNGSLILSSAGGSVLQSSPIGVSSLNVSALTGITLNQANSVSFFEASNSNSGPIVFFNASANLSIAGGGITQDAAAAGAGIQVTQTGALSIDAPINSPPGSSSQIALSSTGPMAVNAEIHALGGDVVVLTANAAGTTTGNFVGIDINGVQVAADSGTVSLNGTGGSTGDDNIGIRLSGGATVASGGLIQVNGTGGAGAGGQRAHGVSVIGSTISAGLGISISGIGGGDAASGDDDGVLMDGASIWTVGAASSVVIDGTSGPGTGNVNTGVSLIGTSIQTEGAPITIHGNGPLNNIGVDIFAGSSLDTQVSGSGISLIGTGHDSGGGVVIRDSGTFVTTLQSITILGTAGTTGNGVDIRDGVVAYAVSSALLQSLGGFVVIQGTLQVDTGNTAIDSVSAIQETSSGVIIAPSGLALTSVGGTNLSGSNQIGELTAVNSGTGDILVKNVSDLLLDGVSNLAAGEVTILCVGANSNLSPTSGGVSTVNGSITLQATGTIFFETVIPVIAGGGGTVTIAADTNALGGDDDGVGTLTIGGFDVIQGRTVTLRGADIDVDTRAEVGRNVTSVATRLNSTLIQPTSVAADAAGNIVVSDAGSGTVKRFSPTGTLLSSNYVPGVTSPWGLAYDSAGNLYVADHTASGSILKRTPAGVVTVFKSGLTSPRGLAVDSLGNVFVADLDGVQIEKITPGGVMTPVTTVARTDDLAMDGAGNLFYAADASNQVYKVTPGGVTTTYWTGQFTAGGGIAVDSSGNVYVSSNNPTPSIIRHTPAGLDTTFSATDANPTGLGLDPSGNLLGVARGAGSLTRYTVTVDLTTSLTVQSSVASRKMSIGGSNNAAVVGINLTNAELAVLFTSATGSINFGDANQTGDITFTHATPATTPGATILAQQAIAGAGSIVLDNVSGTATALAGNAGPIILKSGTGGIVEATSNLAVAFDIDGAPNLSFIASGNVGSASKPIRLGSIGSLNPDSSTGNRNQFLFVSGTLDVYGLNAGTGTVNLYGTSGITRLNAGGTASLIDIQQGVLNINSVVTASIRVEPNTTLSGNGSVGSVLNLGTVAPGNSPGILTINGNYNQPVTARIAEEIAGTNPVVPDFDRIIVNGTVTIAGTLNTSLISGFIPTSGQSFTILTSNGAGPIAGQFSGLPEGSYFAVGPRFFQITYKGGDGNDIVLSAMGVGVTNTNDSGPGSLRQAIIDANASPGPDTIRFLIPGTGVQTIAPLSLLPDVLNVVTIDGTTQSGYAGTPVIQLDGSSLGGLLYGLNLRGGNDVVQGLAIGNFTYTAIVLNSNNNVVRSNWIGVNPNGIVSSPNQRGLVVNGTGNTIGGLGTGQGNLISNSLLMGVDAQASPSTTIQGDVITGNLGPGVSLGYVGAQSATVARNSIVANGGLGVAINFAGNTSGYSTVNNSTVPVANVGAGLDAPVITSASIRAGLLTVTGWARPGAVIEFDAAPSTNGANQGAAYLGTMTEGSAADSDTTGGSYSNAAGSDTAAARFKFTFAVPPTYDAGTIITALGQGTTGHPATSEFGLNVRSDAGGGLVGPIVSSGTNQTILAGELFTYRGTFGDNTSAVISASVDYAFGGVNNSGVGDPGFEPLRIDPVSPIAATSDQYTPTTNGTFTLSRVYDTPGVYTVVVHLSDGALSSSTTMTVTVLPAPTVIDNSGLRLSPTGTTTNTTPAVVTLGDSVTLFGRFDDPNAATGVPPTVDVVWGDGTVTHPVAVPDAGNTNSFTFTQDHLYTAPSAGARASGVYPVAVTITRTIAGQTLTTVSTEGLLYAEVLNRPPTNLVLSTNGGTIAAGTPVTLSAGFSAPTFPDSRYDVTVDWGDGSPVVTLSTIGTTAFNLQHTYSADQVGASELIRVSVADRYQPFIPATASTSVRVTAPTGGILSIATDRDHIVQGESVVLTGTLNPLYAGDAQRVTIDWGDGTTRELILPAGAVTLPPTPHVYPVHPQGQASGIYTIKVTATDVARPETPSISATTGVRVDAVPPTVSNLVLKDVRGNIVTSVLENGTVVLTGTYTNPGGRYTSQAVTIDWGDGSLPSSAAVNSVTHTFTAQHKYGTIRPGSGGVLPTSSLLRITATASEVGTSPAISGSASIDLRLSHAAPKVAIVSGGVSNGLPVLTVPNPGSVGTVSYVWVVDGNQVATGTTYQPSFTPGTNTYRGVKVIAIDNYGDRVTSSTTVGLLADAAPVVVLQPKLPGTDSVLAIDLNPTGNRTIVAGNVLLSGGAPVVNGNRPLTDGTTDLTPIAFDAAGTNVTFIGNQGPDTFNLHADGARAYGMGGDNVFAITPLCTIEAYASSGRNTLDFSSSPFGVTFDLNLTGGTCQNVQPSQPDNNHLVMVNDGGVAGTFSTLVCSDVGGDSVRAASNTTIVGSAGTTSDPANMTQANTVTLVSSSNVTVNPGGTGTTILNAAGSTSAGLVVNGDATAAALASGASTVLRNAGKLTGASFFGDTGSTTFANDLGGTTAGTITFSGDTGSTTFVNGAPAGSTVSFGGDTGSALFTNGTITADASISFTGDTGSVTFINNPGSIAAGSISFTGDTGSTTFINGSPTGDATTVSFGGDVNSTTFSNDSAVILGTVTFSGDANSATFLNSPGATMGGTISFVGDTGSTTFVNGADPSAGTITYSGDTSSATFSNGSIAAGGSISFVGDTGSQTFVNNPGGTVEGTVTFSGDTGSQTFVNGSADGIGSITFNGDTGSTTLTNGDAAVTGTISFNGDVGSQTFINNTGSSVDGTVSFSADIGSQTFVNEVGSSVTGSIGFGGDTGSAVFINGSPGTDGGTISFGGDTGSQTFTNGVVSADASITFTGDIGSSTFVNNPNSVVDGTVTFSGDTGSQTFINGTADPSITFSGDTGAATFTNGTVSETATVSFVGDVGSQTFVNNPGATADGTVTFAGDTGSQTFINGAAGSALDSPISFQGDTGSGGFTNSGTVMTGTVSFSGDTGSQTFVNSPDAVTGGSVVFTGDTGSQTFDNLGTVGPYGTPATISFNGDYGRSIFVNGGVLGSLARLGISDTGSATYSGAGTLGVDATVTFSGDSGSSIFINGAPSGSTVSFGGDTGSAVYSNGVIEPGASVSFVGDIGSSTFLNQPGAVVGGDISFTGDIGSTTFVNGADAGTTVSYGGDGGSAVFSNGSITETGSVSFGGDIGSTTFINNPGSVLEGSVSFGGDEGSSTFINGDPAGGGTTVSFGGDGASTTFQNSDTVVVGTISFNGDTGSSTFENAPGATVSSTSVSFDGDTGGDAFLNAGLVLGDVVMKAARGGNRFVNGMTLPNGGIAGHVAGSVTILGASGNETFGNIGVIDGDVVIQAGDGANTVYNAGPVATLYFQGNPISNLPPTTNAAGRLVPSNQVYNAYDGLSRIRYSGGAGGNLLINRGSRVQSISYESFGGVNYLENFGDAVGSIVMRAGQGQANILTNAGDRVGSIVFTGGSDGGGLYNAGSSVGSIVDYAGGGPQVFSNTGAGNSLKFFGSTGRDIFQTGGALVDPETGRVGSIEFRGGTGNETIAFAGDLGTNDAPNAIVVNAGLGDTLVVIGRDAFVTGLQVVGSTGNLSVENHGTLIGATIDASASSSSGLLVAVGGSIGGGSVYKSAAKPGIVVGRGPGAVSMNLLSFGSIDGLDYQGNGVGLVEMYDPTDLDPTDTTHVSSTHNFTYHAGSSGDALVFGSRARNVSGLSFIGGAGASDLYLNAAGASNIDVVGGTGPITVRNTGDGVTALTLAAGSGGGQLINAGDHVTGLVVRADSTGNASLYNSGNDFGTIQVIGGPGRNSLTNVGRGNAESTLRLDSGTGKNTLASNGAGVGALILVDPTGVDGTDLLLNDGDGVGRVSLSHNRGFATLFNNGDAASVTADAFGGQTAVVNTGAVGSLIFNAGVGTASLTDNGNSGPNASVLFSGNGPNDVFQFSGSAGNVTFDAGTGNGSVILGFGAVGMPGIQGAVRLVAGSGGDNSYHVVGSPTTGPNTVAAPSVTFVPSARPGTGTNTLDFSSYLGGGLNLDLMKTAPQAIAGGLSLTLTDPNEFTKVIGTRFSNTILGNTQASVLYSAALPDASTTSAYRTPAVPNASTQWALLDFDSYADPVANPDPNGRSLTHVYTTEERQRILAILQADYWGPGGASNPWYNVAFATDPSAIPAGTPYATLYFNRTPTNGRPGGESSEIDFGNLDRAGFASIQANGLLGGVDQPPMIASDGSSNFATLSGKIAAHEFEHLLGVRHSDAFGPIGFGIHTPPGSADFNPLYGGPNAAFETFDHIISSPATQGSDRFNDLRPLQIGPRESIKLAFGEQGTILAQTSGLNGSPANATIGSAMPMPLSTLYVPNTNISLPGIEQGMNLEVAAAAAAGRIGIGADGKAAPVYFSFSGKKGQVFTFETESQQLPSNAGGGSVDTRIEILDAQGNLIPYNGGTAVNDDQFEGSDSLLDDVVLPADGTYYVRVTSFAAPAGDPAYDPSNPASPLNPANVNSTLNPVNPFYDPVARAAYIAAGQGTATGNFVLFMYRAAQSDPTAQNTGNTIVARGSGSTLASNGLGDTLVVPGGTNRFLIGGNVVTLSTTSAAATIDLLSSSLFAVTIDGATGSTVPYTIDYGDSSAVTTGRADAGSSLSVSHTYASTGAFNVSVTYDVSGSKLRTVVPVTVDEFSAPTATVVSVPTTVINGTSTRFVANVSTPYPGTTYDAVWTFTSPSLSSPITVTSSATATLGMTSLPLTLDYTFTTDGTYRTSVVVTNRHTNASSPASVGLGVADTFSVTSKVATSLVWSTTPSNLVYNGSAYAPPSIIVRDTSGAIVSGAAVTYTYAKLVNGTPTSIASAPIDTGSYVVTATYNGDSSHFGSSISAAFSILQATPTVRVTTANAEYSGAPYGGLPTTAVNGITTTAGVTYTYTVKGSNVTIPTPTHAGTYTVTAHYAGSTNYAPATGSADFTILAASTSVNGSLTGYYGSTSLTATVTALVGVPPGSVDFFDTTTGVDLGQVAVDSSGRAVLTPSRPLTSGSHSILLTYVSSSVDYANSSRSITTSVAASIFVLNTTATAALSISGSSNVAVPGQVIVASNAASALVVSGSSTLDASMIGLRGGSSVTGSSRLGTTPTHLNSTPADPLAGLPAPTPTGMVVRSAVNLGGSSSLTISPGIYPSISVGGSSRLTMLPGLYVIAGGGLSLTGSSVVTGNGVTIYNAGSNFQTGTGTAFGGISVGGSASLNITAPTTGTYAGIAIFQARDNTKAISLTGSSFGGLNGGTLYAQNAQLTLAGSSSVGNGGSISSLIVGTLNLTGSSGAFQRTDGAMFVMDASIFNWIISPKLTAGIVDDNGDPIDPAVVARVGDAMDYLNQTLAAFGVDLSWAGAGITPDVRIHLAESTPEGGTDLGVLGYTTSGNDVYFVKGWKYSYSTSTTSIAPDEFDFTTLAIHELGHTLGLGESMDPESVMYEYLRPGMIRRTMTDSNLALIDSDSDRFMKIATDPVDAQAIDAAIATLDHDRLPTVPVVSPEIDARERAIDSMGRDILFVPTEVAADVLDETRVALARQKDRKTTARRS